MFPGLSPAVPSLPRDPFVVGWLQQSLREADAGTVQLSLAFFPSHLCLPLPPRCFSPDFLVLPLLFCFVCSPLQPLMTLWTWISFASLPPLTFKKPMPLGRVCRFDFVPSHQQCCFRRSSTRSRAGNYPCVSSLHPHFLWIFHFPSLFTVLMLSCPRSYGINDSCP